MKKLFTIFVLLIYIALGSAYAQIPTTGFVGYWPFNSNANSELAEGISIFPNPVTNNLQIQTALQINNVQITDITGRLLCTSTAKCHWLQIFWFVLFIFLASCKYDIVKPNKSAVSAL